jgi:uncharacterized membrane protein YdbT with pleckstrin-like domain
MPFPRKLLNSYEEVAVDLHPHWMYFAEPVLTLVGVFIATVIVKFGFDFLDQSALVLLCVAGLLAAAGWLGVRYLKWVTTNFVITNDRVIFREGVLAKRGVEIPLERVNNVNFDQSIFERLVGAGDLTIESAGKDGASAFTDIRKPEAVQNLIHAQIEQSANRKWDRAASSQPSTPLPPPAPSGDVMAQLERLDELRQRGVLTQAEFESQKARILNAQ